MQVIIAVDLSQMFCPETRLLRTITPSVTSGLGTKWTFTYVGVQLMPNISVFSYRKGDPVARPVSKVRLLT